MEQALASKAAPGFAVSKAAAPDTEFKRLGTETIPLTGTVAVKFRQTMNGIPIYGSLVTVELDENNKLVGLNSAMGEPKGVNPVAKVSPAEAASVVQKSGPEKKDLENLRPAVVLLRRRGIQVEAGLHFRRCPG